MQAQRVQMAPLAPPGLQAPQALRELMEVLGLREVRGRQVLALRGLLVLLAHRV